MSDFKARIHKIRFPTLGLRPNRAGGDPLAVLRGSTSKGKAEEEEGEVWGSPPIFWPRTAPALKHCYYSVGLNTQTCVMYIVMKAYQLPVLTSFH